MGREWKSGSKRDFNFLLCCLVERDKNSFVWLTKKSEKIENVTLVNLLLCSYFIIYKK